MNLRLSASDRVVLAFASVYLFWGSTYLAIRVAGEHLPVPVVSATRSLISAMLIAILCLMRGKSLRVPAGEPWKLILVGLLFMSANNMLLTLGETMVSSGFASLLISTTPILIAVLETFLPGGETLNGPGWTGTLLGTAGIATLVWPSLRSSSVTGSISHSKPLMGILAILGASACFAVGSVLSRRFRFQSDTLVATGWQIGSSGLFNAALAIGTGGLQRAQWTRNGLIAIVYLSVFGSIFGLVAFTYLLQHVAVTKVATYAFVNPMIAVLLGALMLHERMTPTELAGMGIILCSVAMVVFSHAKKPARETQAV